jgi:hypothetical protein
LDDLRGDGVEKDNLIDVLSGFIVEREIMVIQFEEALSDLDVAIKSIDGRLEKE